jgi:hypothetical protein
MRLDYSCPSKPGTSTPTSPTMRLDLSRQATYNGCAKPGCNTTRVYRHHRGGEHTFVRHFAWMLRVPKSKDRYAEFCRIYHSFRSRDTCNVCGDHHEEIHNRMELFDLDWMVENDCIKAFGSFTWTEAHALIKARQAFTDSWLKIRTPGIKERRFTGRP